MIKKRFDLIQSAFFNGFIVLKKIVRRLFLIYYGINKKEIENILIVFFLLSPLEKSSLIQKKRIKDDFFNVVLTY